MRNGKLPLRFPKNIRNNIIEMRWQHQRGTELKICVSIPAFLSFCSRSKDADLGIIFCLHSINLEIIKGIRMLSNNDKVNLGKKTRREDRFAVVKQTGGRKGRLLGKRRKQGSTS